MDSFYDAPRQPPTVPRINPIERIPLVPEVSIIDNSIFPTSRKPVDYNTAIRPPQNFDNFLNRDSFINLKKHVRFKSHQPGPVFGKENVPLTLKTAPDLNGKTFKQIYMANVPDRHLDLSIFDTTTQDNRRVETNNDITQLSKHYDDSYDGNNIFKPPRQSTTGIESNNNFMQLNKQCDSFDKNKPPNLTPTMCNTKPNDTTTLERIENTASYASWRDKNRNLFINKTNLEDRLDMTEMRHLHRNKPPCTEICIQTEPPPTSKQCTDISTPSDGPTLKDLYELIQKQNEQIMHLQHQVNNLKTSIKQPEIDSAPHEAHTERPFVQDFNSPSKKNLFSFGVKATSVEFSFRGPPHKFRKNDFLEPKIQEIDECNNSTENRSNSLHLDESVDVKSSCMSNVQSIAIEMDDYQGSDEEDEIGLTFYNGLMNQVNNALKNAQKNSECPTPGYNTRQAMKLVKQATLQHLNSIGVNLSPIQESSEATGSSGSDMDDCGQTEVSGAVQQLLMKYLPSDKLAKVMKKSKEPPLKMKDRKLKPLNKEFSFATLQYMKKYNLIDNTKHVDHGKKVPDANPKFLDVTALKLQRKLL